jgi:branched-chain amino acid transport system ATP-binding protein
MDNPVLQLCALHKHFGGIPATENLNLDLQAGEIHAIIGPNGAGKTTLIEQISGNLKPDSGQVLFCGEDITKLSVARRARLGIARSFQITSLILPMSLLENVMLAIQARSGHSFRFWSPAGKNQSMRSDALKYLDMVGLAGRAAEAASAVSHGEQRQLEVAMALAMEPTMLLLDEPMAGMSKEESARMVTMLSNLRQDKTLLLVEHDMDAVFSLADRLSVLVSGRIIETGSVEEVRNNLEVQRAYLGDSHA